MFLLVSVRHVGAHPDEHQHGVSIQISINLGKTFLRISRMRNIPLTWILARVFAYFPTFISQILDFIFRTVLIVILIYFEWRDTENQQYHVISQPYSGPGPFSSRDELGWKRRKHIQRLKTIPNFRPKGFKDHTLCVMDPLEFWGEGESCCGR